MTSMPVIEPRAGTRVTKRTRAKAVMASAVKAGAITR